MNTKGIYNFQSDEVKAKSRFKLKLYFNSKTARLIQRKSFTYFARFNEPDGGYEGLLHVVAEHKGKYKLAIIFSNPEGKELKRFAIKGKVVRKKIFVKRKPVYSSSQK
ncbi:MAG: hypothetical protein WAQ28_02030 [Bacteroidia bacterium]